MNPTATLYMANHSQITIELLPEYAPNTVNSFIHAASHKIFDHHPIERIVPGNWIDMSYTGFRKAEGQYLIPYERELHPEPHWILILDVYAWAVTVILDKPVASSSFHCAHARNIKDSIPSSVKKIHSFHFRFHPQFPALLLHEVHSPDNLPHVQSPLLFEIPQISPAPATTFFLLP